jgi:hypothetical protein
MNRLLIVLCMVGWALYIVHVNSNSRGGQPALSASNSAQPSIVEQTKALSEQTELQPIAPAAVQSPHAISPDETPPKTAANATVPPPQIEPTQNSRPQPISPPQPESSQETGEQLKVTTETRIRSGPSASAQVIGTAHTGAKLRVKSRESGWVQFVDPAAKKTGWISLAYLGPVEARVDARSTVPARPKQPPKVAKAKSPKPTPAIRQSTQTYAELPADQEFVPPRRRGLFGLFWRRRLGGDAFSPPPYP